LATGGETALSLPDGMLAAGATAAPLNPGYTEDEFRFYLEDLAPRALLLPAGGLPAPRAAAAGLGIEVGEVTADGKSLRRCRCRSGAASRSGSTRRRCCRTSRPTSRPRSSA